MGDVDMKKKLLYSVLGVVLSFSILVPFKSKAELYQPKTADILKFQTDWFKQELVERKDENFVISPVSLYQALALFGHGLNGGKLEKYMRYPTDFAIIRREGRGLAPVPLLPVDKAAFRIQLPEDMLSDGQVEISNSIWGDSFLPEYTQDVKKYLNAEAKELPENTSVINKWIKEKTKGKISNLLEEKETDPLDLFLVNTVYFKADWLDEFYSESTDKRPFNAIKGTIDVDMMYDKKWVDYYEDEKMQAIRLPYKSSDGWGKSKHAMTFILPKKEVNWHDFIANLKVQDFYLNFLEKMPVKIYLPKFELEYQPKDMNETLKKMGLGFIYNEGAFLGTKANATLKDVSHKSVISVDEKGTEAAAATVFRMEDGSLNLYPPLEKKQPYFVFEADRPFIFMLDDGLFVGVVHNPNEN